MNYGLSKEVEPEHYSLEFAFDLENFVCKGKETIDLVFSKPSATIVMHAADLKIHSVILLDSKKEIPVKWKLVETEEELHITLPKQIKGKSALRIEFTSHIRNDLAGLYRSKYVHNGKEDYVATTQFEPADARRAYPCFDEPAFKATFDISMVVDKKHAAISNMPIDHEEAQGNRKKVVFKRTPRMSSYLVYLGAGNFEFLQDHYKHTTLRIATTPGKKKYGKFAIDLTKKILEYYNNYFGIDYPLPKLDQIALPDFAVSAMENWGAITYRELVLLYDKKKSSTAAKYRTAEVIAHEIAHQWFGDLVTMEWWNDLWLNESFATWMAYKAIDCLYPDWRMWSQFTDQEIARALRLDAMKSSHPIEASVRKPHEIGQIFDAISYSKGASILRMLEHHVGPDKFRAGLHQYLDGRRFGNATTQDLWAAISSQTGIDVNALMSGWVEQVGYPIVHVELQDNNAVLKQQRYFLDSSQKSPGALWSIPITLQHAPNKNISFIMDTKEKRIDLGKTPEFVAVNAGKTAFFRVKYSEDLLELLKGQISQQKLSAHERWGVQHDLYALARSSEIPFKSYLEIVPLYANEMDYFVIEDIASNLFDVYLLSSGALKSQTKGVLLEFLRSVMKWLGWNRQPREPETTAFMRTTVLEMLARLNDSNVLHEGQQRMKEYLTSTKQNVDPNLLGALCVISAWQGDKTLFETFIERYRTEEYPEDKRRFLCALGGFQQKELLQKALDFSLLPDVRSQDTHVIIIEASTNECVRELLWQWYTKHWQELEERFGNGGNIKLLETFMRPLGMFADINLEKEMYSFFKKQKSFDTINKALSQSLEKLRTNYAFLKNNS